MSIQTTQYILPLVSDSSALKQVQSSLVLNTYLSPLSPSKTLSKIRGNLVPSSLNRKHSYKHIANPPESWFQTYIVNFDSDIFSLIWDALA